MRTLVLVAAFAALCALAPSPAGAEVGRAGSPGVVLQQCSTGPAAGDRAAVFVGRIRAIPGSQRLQLRFWLQSRDGQGRWRGVAGERLGAWNTSDLGVGGYVFTKRVERLAAPGTYRVLVHYRWLDAEGGVIRADRRTSAVCRQPDFRPDLRPVSVSVATAGEGARYRITIANTGSGTSAPFDLALSIGEQPAALLSSPELAGGASVALEHDGPPCPPGAVVTVVVDLASATVERREGDNVLRVSCPVG